KHMQGFSNSSGITLIYDINGDGNDPCTATILGFGSSLATGGDESLGACLQVEGLFICNAEDKVFHFPNTLIESITVIRYDELVVSAGVQLAQSRLILPATAS